jgi:hypothetical protein
MQNSEETKRFYDYIKENYIDMSKRTFRPPGPLLSNSRYTILLIFPNVETEFQQFFNLIVTNFAQDKGHFCD